MKTLLAFGALAAAIIFFGVELADFFSGNDDIFTDPERASARLVLSAKKEHAAAVQISNSKPAFSQMSEGESSAMIVHYTKALEYAESIPDAVLEKIHPAFRRR